MSLLLLAPVEEPGPSGEVSFTGEAELSVVGTVVKFAAVQFAGTATLSFSATTTRFAAVSFTGTATLSAESTDPNVGAVSFAGTASLSVTATVAASGAVSFSGTATLAVVPPAAAGPPAVSFTGIATLGVDAPTTTVMWALVSFTGEASFGVFAEPKATGRRLVITDAFGNLHGELTEAEFGDLTWELNTWEQWSFTLPKDHPSVELVTAEQFRECQYWSGDQLLAWGPIVRTQVDEARLTANCAGAAWHLSRRFVGPAVRHNYLANGDFEAGLGHWDFFTSQVFLFYGWPGAQATPPIHSIVRDPVLTGKRALRMENYVTGADAGAAAGVHWTVTDPEGDEFILKGYLYLESFEAGAHENRGLYLERFSTTEPNPDPNILVVHPDAKKSLQHEFVPIDDSTPIGVWQRFEISLTTPPKAGEPENVQVRLYPPYGVVYWDAVGLYRRQALKFRRDDQASVIVRDLVAHAQDGDYGKSDVNLATQALSSGVRRDRTYWFDERPNIWDSISEFTSVNDGIDVSTTYTPTTRALVTHPVRKGRRVPQAALQTGRNIATYSWNYDGEGAATSVVVLGQGDGPDREEGAANDTSGFPDGLTLEEVFSAPPETPIDSLDNIATEKLEVARIPEVLTVRTHPHATNLLGRVQPGDTVPVRIAIKRGEVGSKVTVFEINDDYRVIRMVLHTDMSIDLTLNRRAA